MLPLSLLLFFIFITFGMRKGVFLPPLLRIFDTEIPKIVVSHKNAAYDIINARLVIPTTCLGDGNF